MGGVATGNSSGLAPAQRSHNFNFDSKHCDMYSRTFLIWTPVIRAPPQLGSWFHADIAEIVGSTLGVAYYSLYIFIVFWDTDKSQLQAPHNPKVPG